MTITRTAILTVITAVLTALTCGARKQSTSHGHIKAAATTAESRHSEAAYETVDSIAGLSLYGYDKPLNASAESFYAVNGSGSDIVMLTVEFTYFDMKGRQLHKAEHTLRCDIPAGETRKLSVPTWDRQHSLYYYKSTVPRRSATPYSVTHVIKAAGIMPADN